MMPKIKRFAGTSGGAIVATLASIGCTSDEMKKYMEVDFKSIMFGKSHVYQHTKTSIVQFFTSCIHWLINANDN